MEEKLYRDKEKKMIFDGNGREESIHPTTIIVYVVFYLIWVYFSNLSCCFEFCIFALKRKYKD